MELSLKEGTKIAKLEGKTFLRINSTADHEINYSGFSTTLPQQKKREKSMACFTTQKSLKPIPTENKERDVIYISGKSGSGKSYFCAMYVKNYQKKYPKRNVYLISPAHDPDPAFNDLDVRFISVMELQNDMNESDDSLEASDFQKSLVIFDDDDSISNTGMRKFIFNLKTHCMEIGRKMEISVLTTSHMLTAALRTKAQIAESNIVVFFPKMGGTDKQIRFYLKEYLGYEKSAIETIMNLPDHGARWVMVSLAPLRFVMWEHGVYLL